MKYLLLLILIPAASVFSQYTFKSPYLQAPYKMIGYVDSCARFWQQAYDPSSAGGFYMNIDRTGNLILAWGTGKNSLNQSRDAYGFIRAYQMTGNEQWLDYARRALAFLYANAWDKTNGGWITSLTATGVPSSATEAKTAYFQHYAALGITAAYEATRDTTDWAWLMKSTAYNEAKLWDARPAYFGYYDNVKYNGSSPAGKSFNATVDAVTTHLLHLYLMTGDADYKTRLMQLSDNMINRLYQSSKTQAIGFAELYDASWIADNGTSDNAKRTIMGHVLKTSWCLARIYEFTPDTAYLGTARRLTEMVWQKGYDHQFGGPYKDYERATGVMMSYGQDTAKAWWQMEQAITDGLFLYHLTGNPQYAQMADETLDFFMNYFVDHTYGDVYSDRTKRGASIPAWGDNKGNDGKAAYHSIETGYYVYLYGSLLINRSSATLTYKFAPNAVEQHYAMNPISCTDPAFVISRVYHDNSVYTLVDKKNRIITVPAGVSGTFQVTYDMSGATDVASASVAPPANFALSQNYPNPFNPTTMIQFELPASTQATLTVFDLLGREVATLVDGMLSAGSHGVQWNAAGMPSGVYIYRLQTAGGSLSKKLILAR